LLTKENRQTGQLDIAVLIAQKKESGANPGSAILKTHQFQAGFSF